MSALKYVTQISAHGWKCRFHWAFSTVCELYLLSISPSLFSSLPTSQSLSPHLMLPPNEKWRQCNLLYCPAGLPSPQQQQIKSEQRWANRQKFTPLSPSISTAVDNNPDLPFPLVFAPKAPTPPVHFKKTGFHCDCCWQPNPQIHLCWFQCHWALQCHRPGLGPRNYNVFQSGGGIIKILKLRKSTNKTM